MGNTSLSSSSSTKTYHLPPQPLHTPTSTRRQLTPAERRMSQRSPNHISHSFGGKTWAEERRDAELAAAVAAAAEKEKNKENENVTTKFLSTIDE